MAPNDTQRAQAVASAIKRYLEDHPHAADTIEGVAQWWLRSTHRDIPVAVVQQALDYLVSKGIIAEIETWGRKVYRSARQTP